MAEPTFFDRRPPASQKGVAQPRASLRFPVTRVPLLSAKTISREGTNANKKLQGLFLVGFEIGLCSTVLFFP